MKRVVLLALVAIAVVAVSAPTAAARHTIPHRIAALEKKVNALHTFAHSCLAADWVPIGWYGDEQAGVGYMFDNDGANPAQAPFYTTALDIAASPAETSFYVARVRPTCLGQIAARRAFTSTVADLRRSVRALR